MKFTLILLFTFFAAFPAEAIDLNPFSIIKGAVEAAVEDRTSDDIKKDLKIKASLTAEVIDKMGKEVISISAEVLSEETQL
ncbi:MAG: hypothetical protein O3B76_10080 [Proteobacteria bacterium]|nr:hypothetical protein [Pseudomonadota bacterium]